ncbi:hypothetical protein [Hyalangium gracile]|uniref:hypothetical protein n=1 Tax=Hyalangium gracile TaxID=394092 RepID=UPI001CCB1979|nr:hypothetical protein [Hyalangium gracile]
MFDKEVEEFVGVKWVEEEQVAIGYVEADGERLYEDVFAQETDAALGRDLAIVAHGWNAVRNYPDASLDDLVARLVLAWAKRF